MYKTSTQLLCNRARSPVSQGRGWCHRRDAAARHTLQGRRVPGEVSAGGRCVPLTGVCPRQCVSSASPTGPFPPLPSTAVAWRWHGSGMAVAARAAGLGALAAPSRQGGHCGSLNAASLEQAARAKQTELWSHSLFYFHVVTLFYSPHQRRIGNPSCLLGCDTCPSARTPVGSPELLQNGNGSEFPPKQQTCCKAATRFAC